jgi:acyl carrier protein
MSLRAIIMDTIQDVAASSDVVLVEPLTDETVLLQSGLDSLGFAILVARLEEELEFDPFTMTDEPIYPRTLGEFIGFYEQMSSKR